MHLVLLVNLSSWIGYIDEMVFLREYFRTERIVHLIKKKGGHRPPFFIYDYHNRVTLQILTDIIKCVWYNY